MAILNILRRRRKKVSPKISLLSNELQRRATAEAADFVQHHLATALLLGSSADIRSYSMSQRPKDGLILEFGVFTGGSINHLADLSGDASVYGFDSFKGLSEHWVGTRHWKGRFFDLKGRLPQVRPNVKLIQGWIDETLPPFLAENAGPIAFIHIDTDTYAPCKTILSLCKDRLMDGSIILFDEMLCYPGWRHGEFKALTEEIEAARCRWIAFSGECAAVQITATK